MIITLKKFPYKYMEYENRMMAKEIQTVIPNVKSISDSKDIVTVVTNSDVDDDCLVMLALFHSYRAGDDEWKLTLQGKFEGEEVGGKARQHTRYSSHGLHEYKGKYNPQIVRIMLNILGLNGKKVLDPFDGSGTSILECAHVGTNCIGMDINPMACYIANTKVASLSIDTLKAKRIAADLLNKIDRNDTFLEEEGDRLTYLKHWVPEENLRCLESIRDIIQKKRCEESIKDLFLIAASDLIRDYSNQEPSDLRIRKRTSPFPEKEFPEAYGDYLIRIIDKIEYMQQQVGKIESKNHAICCDSKDAVNPLGRARFDGAITSPPYVTALPYIDTQRISLVWLGLCEASEIMELESTLIGSREFRKQGKNEWNDIMDFNKGTLPENIHNLTMKMKNCISEKDGFRKRAMPALTYRYFSDMKSMFINVKKMLKVNAPYALIVGQNRTTLGGTEFRIDTPRLLADIAVDCGWILEDIIELETYKRYGINSKNAINNESMIVLRNR